MRQSNRGDLRPIASVIEAWLSELGGPARLAAFYELPDAMQRGAWGGLRREVELEREKDEA